MFLLPCTHHERSLLVFIQPIVMEQESETYTIAYDGEFEMNFRWSLFKV